jgi:alanyl-tRNA synthetase
MHPLVPYLLGEKHPLGKRLVDVQKCIRTGDIDDVGDAWHLSFFEMMGHWSLGDYFKKEAIEMSFEFLTSKKYLGISIEKLSVTCFAGDKDAPCENEANVAWEKLGVPKETYNEFADEEGAINDFLEKYDLEDMDIYIETIKKVKVEPSHRCGD